ncbi:uncharacterized protein At4g37920 [Physcomitrium patens]|uniref:Uncharacterized protein n=1 Tax=Physcomitrium patens TaxID=3218 RepID=A0A2K1JLL2_PHYPA|nr:uncharacterized protein At4g37920-like [Physcomitrium patens]PNR42440.1 hypothetical protein PHYPA_017269 [Physcomitrium patens]|eukprot:XP_024392048.1 uncharacterized protein At4g37920-like [Physcomitrella patens]
MTVAIASRVALTGALSGREYVSVTIPFGSLLVVNSRSRAQLQAWLVPNRKELIVGDQRRGVHGYVSRSSPSRGIAANAIEDKVSRSRLPHSNKKDDGEALKLSQDIGILKDSEAAARIRENSNESENMVDTKMNPVCDKLIDVFLVEKTKPEDWRILIAFSKEWPTIRPYFFRRCDSQAKAAVDPKKRADLLKLVRQMKEVDDDMQRHDKTIAMLKESPLELDTIVARHRQDFTGDFFQHLHLRIEACRNDAEKREELETLASNCLAAVEGHDRASVDEQNSDLAQMKYEDILSSPSLEAATAKIDHLAKTNQLDSTFMLLMTKAWASAKESTLMTDEAKDILYYLYKHARANMAKSVPKEVHIIRHLLSIEDPCQRLEEMEKAFTPGDELEGIYTEPEKLLEWISAVLEAFYSKQKGTLIKEAEGMLNPSFISRLVTLRDLIVKYFI